MSADGSIMVGTFIAGPKSGIAFRWTSAGGLEEIGGDMDAVSISRDGKTIVGSAFDSQRNRNAAIWMGGKNWKLLGGVPGGVPDNGSLSQAFGVSADGSVIVGTANLPNHVLHAFRWDALSGMTDLGTGVGNQSSYAIAVSANGKAVVGWAGNQSASSHVGNSKSGAVFVDGFAQFVHPYGWAGTAYATNDVGSTIVGSTHPENAAKELASGTTWRWSAWDGRLEDLGAVPLGPESKPEEYSAQPYGVSDSGNVIVGVAGFFKQYAYLWTPATGMVTITDLLTANGVTSHKGWDMRRATFVSPDGKVILGQGFSPIGAAEGWIVTLP
jgi:probable HAF family extracellular repeat protein